MDKVETLVIGAGVVGLAIGAELSKSQNALVIEQNAHFGEHTSSRNSEVIHAGIYYPENSLKASLCVQGKAHLYKHCQAFHVPVKPIGKVLIAQNDDEAEKLETIRLQALNNGVDGLVWLSKQAQKDYAPDLHFSEALYSPSTGIIDSHQLMYSFITQIEQNQSLYVANTRFVKATPDETGFVVYLLCDGEEMQLHCKNLINTAGLFAQDVARHIEGVNDTLIPELHYCRGQYFTYQGKHPFKHLIYPIPEQHGLGIHATLDMANQLKFGPDTEFIDSLNYQTDETQKAKFVSAIKRYWPNLDETKLHCDYAGIRPKLTLSGQQDFIIQTELQHGITGLVNLFGIESPGLTASMAIAKLVAHILIQQQDC